MHAAYTLYQHIRQQLEGEQTPMFTYCLYVTFHFYSPILWYKTIRKEYSAPLRDSHGERGACLPRRRHHPWWAAPPQGSQTTPGTASWSASAQTAPQQLTRHITTQARGEPWKYTKQTCQVCKPGKVHLYTGSCASLAHITSQRKLTPLLNYLLPSCVLFYQTAIITLDTTKQDGNNDTT